MSKLLVLFILTHLLSCSTYRPPEAFEAKMNRFSGNSDKRNIVPNIYTQPLLLENRRMPASISPEIKIKPLNYSNKILYFLGLHTQYRSMRNYGSASTPIIKSCPHFHSALLETQNKKQAFEFIVPKGAELDKISSLYINAKNNPGLFPELHLPLEKGNIKNTVFSKIKNDKKIDEIPFQIQTAINIHLEKTYGEIQELCSTGSSTNYFIFENLSRYQKSNPMRINEQALNSFFKTTLISNMAILKSLEAWSERTYYESNEQINNEIMKRIQGNWFGNYLSKLISERKKLSLTGNNKVSPLR